MEYNGVGVGEQWDDEGRRCETEFALHPNSVNKRVGVDGATDRWSAGEQHRINGHLTIWGSSGGAEGRERNAELLVRWREDDGMAGRGERNMMETGGSEKCRMMRGYKDREEPSCVHERCLPARWALAFHLCACLLFCTVHGAAAIMHRCLLLIV